MSSTATSAETALTLTRAEAYAVSCGLSCTSDAGLSDTCYDSRDDCCALIQRMQCEIAVRDGGGWWTHTKDPSFLDTYEKLREDGDEEYRDFTHPETFTMEAGGVLAIVALLPTMLAEIEESIAWEDSPTDGAGRPKGEPNAEDIEYRERLVGRRAALLGLAARLGVEIPDARGRDDMTTLTVVAGGASLTDEQIERQWLAAWALIAEATERGLIGLHPLHPRRDEMLSLVRDARSAADLPAGPRLGAA